jgi:hypothetical protein
MIDALKEVCRLSSKLFWWDKFEIERGELTVLGAVAYRLFNITCWPFSLIIFVSMLSLATITAAFIRHDFKKDE